MTIQKNALDNLAELLKPGEEQHRIVLPTGTRVTGKLVYEGKPAAGQRVAVAQMERGVGHHFIKAVGAVTDAGGKFMFEHLPPSEDYAIFTVVEHGPQPLVLTTKKFRAYANGKERDLGDLSEIPALYLKGRVEIPPGESLPANAKIVLGRNPAWDLIAVPIQKDGSFVIEGLPPEVYKVEAAVKGFELDSTKLSYQVLSHGGFGLRLKESMDDLRIPLVRSLSKAKR